MCKMRYDVGYSSMRWRITMRVLSTSDKDRCVVPCNDCMWENNRCTFFLFLDIQKWWPNIYMLICTRRPSFDYGIMKGNLKFIFNSNYGIIPTVTYLDTHVLHRALWSSLGICRNLMANIKTWYWIYIVIRIQLFVSWRERVMVNFLVGQSFCAK